MRNFTLSRKNVFLYRIIFAGLSWFTILTGMILSIIESGSIIPWLTSFRYYTMQTNLMVSIWFTLAIIWHNKPEALERITGIIKSAFTIYITVTFVIFALLLSWLYHPTGFAAFSNLVLHYITPIAFIVDWLLTENEKEYKWKYLLYWVSYPLGYLVFALIHGVLTGNYLYPFLDINILGIIGFVLSLSFLVVFFLSLGSIFIVINKKRMKK